MKKLIAIILTIAGFYASAFDSASQAGEKAGHHVTAKQAALAGL